MALNIRNPGAEQLATRWLREQVAELQAFLRSQPDRDTRPADALLGYDRFGLPG